MKCRGRAAAAARLRLHISARAAVTEAIVSSDAESRAAAVRTSPRRENRQTAFHDLETSRTSVSRVQRRLTITFSLIEFPPIFEMRIYRSRGPTSVSRFTFGYGNLNQAIVMPSKIEGVLWLDLA